MQIQIGKGITVDADLDRLGFPGDPNLLAKPEFQSTVPGHVIYIGLRNMLMDAHAGITTDEPDYQAKARAVAEKKLEAMYNGEVRVVGTREGDPVRAEAKRLALLIIKAQCKRNGKKFTDLPANMLREFVDEIISRPEFLAKAEARVAEARALQGAVDISGL